MTLTYSPLFRLLTLGLWWASCYAADRPSKADGAELLAKAVSLQNIREQGAQPFDLRMHIHSERLTSKPAEISYSEVWLTPDHWRREIALPGFSQLEVGDVDSEWLTRNVDFRPRPIYLTSVALENFVHPGRGADSKVKSVRSRTVRGVELRCVEIMDMDKDKRNLQELCFDGSGVLVLLSAGYHRFEYSDFGKFGSKIFPGSIRVYESNDKVLEITADELRAPSDTRDVLFQHDAGAHHLSICARSPKLLKKIAPQYPPEARRKHEQGTVILYALLSGSGEVEKTRVLQSAGASLDESAKAAVQQWVYTPPSCGVSPLEMEIEVQVIYELRPN